MAVRDAARVLDIPHGKLERLHRVLPDDPRIPLKLAMARNPCLRAECDSDPACRQLVTAVSVLEGLCRNTGTHASGIVISDIPLTVIVPLALDRDGQPVTQYSMEHLAGAGLLKIDLPGLRTLSVVRDALDLAAAGGKPAPDLDSIPHDDAATIDLLDCGNTVGVFQLERDGMRDLLRRLGPARMEDLVTALALYRPGATHVLEDFIRRKTGRAPCEPPHQLLRPVLKQTFGMLLFQEQLIAAICTLAGYTQGEADLLRRAMNGKDPEALDAMRDKFAGGCAKKHRMPRETADDIFDILSRSAGTGFNMAHGVALAALSYKTAYLKANLPAEFMAALLSSEMGEAGKIQAYINEANAMGLRILRPDINQSDARFLPTADGIRFGLCGIRNINGAAIDALLAERAARGPFAGLIDFCSRVDSQLVHRKVIESLLRAGCFDSTGLHRARLHRGLNAAMSCAAQALRDVHSGQASLFGVTTGGLALRDEDVMPDCERWHESR
ncbi:MAG: DNA polymerase III subunit alpha, partial [bacterium]